MRWPEGLTSRWPPLLLFQVFPMLYQSLSVVAGTISPSTALPDLPPVTPLVHVLRASLDPKVGIRLNPAIPRVAEMFVRFEMDNPPPQFNEGQQIAGNKKAASDRVFEKIDKNQQLTDSDFKSLIEAANLSEPSQAKVNAFFEKTLPGNERSDCVVRLIAAEKNPLSAQVGLEFLRRNSGDNGLQVSVDAAVGVMRAASPHFDQVVGSLREWVTYVRALNQHQGAVPAEFAALGEVVATAIQAPGVERGRVVQLSQLLEQTGYSMAPLIGRLLDSDAAVDQERGADIMWDLCQRSPELFNGTPQLRRVLNRTSHQNGESDRGLN